MELRKNLSILALSIKEERVLLAIIKGIKTPLLIAKETRVTRPAVYDILTKLKDRGLVKSYIVGGKKSWRLAHKDDIDEALYETKKVLLSISEGVEEVKGLSDGTVIVHRGKDAVLKMLLHITKDHKNERLYGLQGNTVQQGWDNIVGPEKINEFNNDLRKNNVITEAILPYEWFEDHVRDLGEKEGFIWLKGFIGRAYATYLIDKKYFNHAGQIFMFKSSLYLMAMNEALVVEIRNSELQKMIKQMFSYIEEHAEKVDVNSKLQRMIDQLEEKNK